MPDEVSQHAQSYFVEKRKGEMESTGKVETGADQFHLWLTMARLQTLSHGATSLTKEYFDRAIELEN